ncbi:MAG: hypothetical protein AB2L07_18935 [Thermoanaerobaculaceae bacterium]
MAGITAYVGATHLLVFLRVLREREHLAFAALCGGVLAYELLSAGLYSADTPLHATGWQVGLAWAVVFSCAAVVWFTAEHLGVMSRAIGAGLAVVPRAAARRPGADAAVVAGDQLAAAPAGRPPLRALGSPTTRWRSDRSTTS